MNNFDKYEKAVDYLYSFINYEQRRNVSYNPENYNLERVNKLLSALKYEQTFKVIHIAGTKGKGSTANICASILQNLGFKCGLFTSPHILDLRERIKVNSTMIEKAELIGLINQCKEYIENCPKEDIPTTFEILTALALKHYQNENVSYAVIETGMGGRLDSTNIVKPDVCILTSISFDHMDKLGNTIEEIAGEKAGIIKPGAAVISAAQLNGAAEVISKKANDCGCKVCFYLSGYFKTEILSASASGSVFLYFSKMKGMQNGSTLKTSLPGVFQIENIALAIRAIEKLGVIDAFNRRIVKNTLLSLKIPGRMESISDEPLIILDGAHNKDSIEKLLFSVHQVSGGSRLAVLFSPLAGKDIRGMLEALKVYEAELIISAPKTHKHISIDKTAEEADELGIKYEIEESFVKAADKLKSMCIEGGKCGVITGSLYAVSTYHEEKLLERAV